MGIFDEDLSDELKPKESQVAAKKQWAKQAGLFDEYLTPEPQPAPIKMPAVPVDTSTPTPTQTKQTLPGYTPLQPSVTEGFAKSIETGNYAVNGKKNRVDPIAAAYDAAPDKWKYKQTLTNTQLETLKALRPESTKVSSISEEEKARQREVNTVKIAPGLVDYVPDTKLEAPKARTEPTLPGENEGKVSIRAAISNKFNDLYNDVLNPEETDIQRSVSSQDRNAALVSATERDKERRANLAKSISEQTKKPIDPTTGGEFYKALKQGLLRDVPRGFFSSIEAITEGDGSMKTVNDWAGQQADSFLASKLLHPEENAPSDLKGLTEGGWKDPRYWERGAGQLLSTAIPAFTSAIGVGLVTKNPALAARVGGGMIFSQETGQAYNDLVDSGFAPEDARKGAIMYGAVATALENVNFGKTLNKILWPGKTTMVTQSFKNAFIDTLQESGMDVVKEAGTEAAQQFAQNVMTKWYDENQDLMEGVADSAALGGLGGVAFGSVNAAIDLRDKYFNTPSEARDIMSGMRQATPEEMAAAESALNKFTRKAKETVVSVSDPALEQSVKVKTVTYDDGKVAREVTINTSPEESVTVPLSGEFANKEEAIKDSMETAKGVIQNSDTPSIELIAQIDSVAKEGKQSVVDTAETKAIVEPVNQPTNGNDNRGQPEAIPDTGKVPSGKGTGSSAEAGGWQGSGDGGTGAGEAGIRPQGDRQPGVRFTKTQRAKTNTEAKAILEEKGFSTNLEDYSPEEVNTLASYTGAGGKEAAGASGRGLLDEYYTPKPVVKAMYDIAKTLGDTGTILEPSAGTGRFIESAPKGSKVTAMEIDKTSGTIAKILNPSADVRIGDFQDNFIEKGGKSKPITETYDLVIGNPPYGERSGFQKGLGEEKSIGRQEEYFIKRGLDMTKDGGTLVYIVPSSFLDKATSKGKQAIAKNASLVAAYRLPEGVFEDTSIGTDIVVFRKGTPSDPSEISGGTYFEQNPQNVFGETTQRKNKFGKMENVVTGDKDAALSKLQKAVGELTRELPKTVESMPKETTTVTVEEKAPVERTPGKTAKITKTTTVQPVETKDVKGIKVSERQTVGGEVATQQEFDMYKTINQDGSVEYKEEWAPFLNYEDGKYYPDEVYFSGDVRKRLAALEKVKKQLDPSDYEKQKKGLMEVMPKDKTIGEILFDPMDRFLMDIQTGGTKTVWVPGEGRTQAPKTLMDEFMDWIFRIDHNLIGFNVHRADIQNYVQGERQRANTKNNTGNIKAESKRLFNTFMQEGLEPETQAKILDTYNREKNSYVRPEYSKFPVEVEGMATEFGGQPFNLSPTQKTGVGFLVTKGSGLIAYGVGVGKTHTMLVATAANMQKGWTKRPLFIVPASTLEGWVNTSKQMFPDIKVNNLAGLQADVVRKLRKTGEPSTWLKDGEFNFITHEGILKLGFSEEEMYDLTSDVKDALFSFDSKMTERQREKNKDKVMEQMGAAMKGSTDITVKDLGIDHVSVDEVHNFRKVFQGTLQEKDEEGKTQKKRYAGTVGGTPSARARKLFLLSQYIQKNNQGRNVFLASATPFENHATEVYNVLSFMARDRMKEMGIYNVNDFYAAFADFRTDIIQKPDGSATEKEVMKEYSNLPILQSLLKEFIDRKEDETLVRPDKVVLKPVLKMSPLQERVKSKVVEHLSSDEPGAMLVGIGEMRRNAVSPFFVEKYAGTPEDMYEFVNASPKIKYTMDMIKAIKEDPRTSSRGSFIYVGDNIQYLDLYKEYLVKEVGYKPEEVGIIFGDVSDEQREDIKEKFNSGEIKVLIGGTPTKEGINLQKNGYATFNIALGWNPTEMAQVEGRVWRQGNDLSHTPIIYPLVENSGDVNIYQKFEEKGSRINDLFSYDGQVFDMGELDPREMKLMLLTDPIEKANFETELDKRVIQNDILVAKTELSLWESVRDKIAAAKYTIDNVPQKIERTEAEIARINASDNDYAKRSVERLKDEVKEYKSEISAAKERLKTLELRLATEGIQNLNEKVEQSKKMVATKEKELVDVKLQTPALIEKYRLEAIENEKNARTMEEMRAEVINIADTLSVRSPEDMIKEKQRLTQIAEEKRDNQREEVLLKIIPKQPVDQPIPENSSTRTPTSAKRGKDGVLLSVKKMEGIRNATQLAAYDVPNFKLSDRVKAVIKKFNTSYTKYVPKWAVGAFYSGSNNIAFTSINDVHTVTHELSHFIDKALGITRSLMEPQGMDKDGLPLYMVGRKPLMAELTKVYVKYYPGAKKTDKLEVRLQEGYATYMEKFLDSPQMMAEEYPLLFQSYIVMAGELQDTLNNDMARIVQDYLNLSAKGKMDSVITSKTKNVEADSWLNLKDRVLTIVTDALFPIYKLETLLQTKGANSAYNALQQTNTVMQRIYKNLTVGAAGKYSPNKLLKLWPTGYYNFSGGAIKKIYDYNWADLVNSLGSTKMADDFGTFLVARDQFFQWKKLDDLTAKFEVASNELLDPFISSRQRKDMEDIVRDYQSQKSYMAKNSELFSREDVTNVYEDWKNIFEDHTEMYDTLVHADLNALRESGRLSEEKYIEYSENEGYATMKRIMEDQIGGTAKQQGMSIQGRFVSKATQLKTRTGGTQDIINPLVGAMLNHSEAMGKTHKQMAMNKLFDIVQMFPNLAQEIMVDKVFTGEGIMHQVNGQPVGSDKNTIVKWTNGEPRVLLVKNEEIGKNLDAFINPLAMSGMEEFLQKFTKAFVIGTTGLWSAFAIGNTTVDQFTAMVNSQQKYKPFADQLKIVYGLVQGQDGTTGYAREYLDLGGHETMLNLTDLSGDELIKLVQDEANGLKKVVKLLEAGVDVLKLPANLSETATRIVEYVKSREAGNDVFTALEQAGQVTTPFHHRGTAMLGAGRIILRNIPYLNATIQASAQFMKTVGTKQGLARYGLVLAGVTAMIIGALAIAPDDEDAERAFANLDPKELAKYFFFYRGNGEFYKMKIPEQLAFIGALYSMAYSDAKFNAQYSTKEYIDAATAFIPDAFNLTDPERAAIAWIPQMIKPAMEVFFNKKSFPAVRDLESRAALLLPSDLRGNEAFNSPVAMAISKTGFAKELGLSAIQIDHLLEGYLGRSVGFLTGKPSAYNQSNPIERKEFFSSSRMVQRFFDDAEKLEQEKNAVNRGSRKISPEDEIILTAKLDRVEEIKELLKTYSEKDGVAANPIRRQIWEKLEELQKFRTEDLTDFDRLDYQKKVTARDWKAQKESLIDKYTQFYQDSKEPMKATKLERQLKEELGGSKMDDSQKSKYNALVRSLRMINEAGGDKFVAVIADLDTNAEKALAFKQKKATMGKNEFDNYVAELYRKKVISKELKKTILNSD